MNGGGRQSFKIALVGLAAAAAAACGSFAVTFIPYAPRHASIDRAVWAYPGDIAAIAAGGGWYVGSLQTESHRVSDNELIERIVVEAARVGGTHVIQVDAASHAVVTGYAPIVANTQARVSASSLGGVDVNGTTTITGGGPRIERWDLRTYDVFYVPRHAWSNLPAPLQPF